MVAVVAALSCSCGAADDSTTPAPDLQGGQHSADGSRQLRSVGIHANAQTGLVAVVLHDVTLVEGQLPDITTAWGYTNRPIPQTIPDTCVATVEPRDGAANEGFSTGMQFDAGPGERVRIDRYVTWSAATIALGGCGSLDGAIEAQSGVFVTAAKLPDGTPPDSVWSIIPLFLQYNVKGPSSMPVRLPSEILASNTGAGPIVFASVPTAPLDPLADDIERLARPLPRSTTDRPDDDPDGAQLKFIYVVPSFAQDRGRDTSGEISRFAAYAGEWWSLQNAGFGLRIDTYKGAVDVGYLTIDMTKEKWNAYFADYNKRPLFHNGLAEFQDVLADAGWGNTRRLADDVAQGGSSQRDAAISNGKLYMLVLEAPAGTYGRTGASRECIAMGDAINDRVPVIGFAQSQANGASCGTMADVGRYPDSGSASQQATWVRTYFGAIDFVMQWMRNLPRCSGPETPKDGERVRIPGVIDESRAWEVRGGFMRDLAEPYDPTSDAFSAGAALGRSPVLDPRHDLYFHITSDKLASKGRCNSDTSKHPLWDDKPFNRDADLGLPRTSYDRPDDIVGAQLKAVYAVKRDAEDRWFDTRGEIQSALLAMQAFVEASTNGANTVRIDTFEGRPDIMYFPVPEAVTARDPASCIDTPCPNDQSIFKAMKEAGRLQDGKQYLIFYDGGIEFGGQGLCGGSAQGRTSMINLSGVTSEMCDHLQFAAAAADEWSVGLLSLHELFHALGAVCSSAANVADGMHSSTPGDMMSGRATGRVLLDPGKSYWYDAPRGCTALSRSPLFARDK